MAPLIGSLLRLPREVIVSRMLAAVHSHAFDITATELSVFMFPGPDRRRPIDLARQCGMSRQAMNYVLAGLERRGFVERHSGANAAARLVHLTPKGWQVIDLMRRCVAEIEREWSGYLGERRFKALSETLRELSQWLGKLP
jgi:DNA-binding MarR family transcriptional regulator